MNKKELEKCCDTINNSITFDAKQVKGTRFGCYMYNCVEVFIKNKDYYTCLDKLFTHYNKKKISLIELQKLAKDLISKNQFSFTNFDNAVSLKKEKIYTYYHRMYGVYLESNESLILGKYKIYNEEKGLQIINDNIESEQLKIKKLSKKLGNSCVIVGINISGCDMGYVTIEAQKELSKLTNLLNFFAGCRQRHNKIGIKNIITEDDSTFIISSTGDEGQIGNNMGEFNLNPMPIDFNGCVILDKKYGFNKIWEISKKDNKSEIEQRIFESILWLGMAVGEWNNSIACMECVFAIEKLLKTSDDFLSKSIGAQLKETCAFIYSDEKEKRIATDNLVTKMFKSRSTVAHGTQKNISDKEINEYIDFTKQLIIKFISLDFKTIEDVTNFVNEKRYS